MEPIRNLLYLVCETHGCRSKHVSKICSSAAFWLDTLFWEVWTSNQWKTDLQLIPRTEQKNQEQMIYIKPLLYILNAHTLIRFQ